MRQAANERWCADVKNTLQPRRSQKRGEQKREAVPQREGQKVDKQEANKQRGEGGELQGGGAGKREKAKAKEKEGWKTVHRPL